MADISKINLPDGSNYNIKAGKADTIYMNRLDGMTVSRPLLMGSSSNTGYNTINILAGGPVIDDNGDIVVDNSSFPYRYSDNEQVVGYWNTIIPVYEKTIELTSEVTIAAGNSSAAGAWTVVQTGWTTPVFVLDFKGYRFSTTGDPTYYGHLTGQWERSNNRIRVLNIRSQTMPLNAFTIRYMYQADLE
jgi:hypothetical protein